MVIYTESKEVVEIEVSELRSDEETPQDSRAGTSEYEPVQPEKADFPGPQHGLVAGLFDEEIDMHPKYFSFDCPNVNQSASK